MSDTARHRTDVRSLSFAEKRHALFVDAVDHVSESATLRMAAAQLAIGLAAAGRNAMPDSIEERLKNYDSWELDPFSKLDDGERRFITVATNVVGLIYHDVFGQFADRMGESGDLDG